MPHLVNDLQKMFMVLHTNNNNNIQEKQKKGVKQETCDLLVTLTWLGNHILKMNWIPAIFKKTWDNTCHLDA